MIRNAFVSLALCAAAASGLAHGDKPPSPAAALLKEQKPWGIAGDAKAARRTITVDMTDNMRFKPDRIALREGETVKFVVVNKGKMLHEMVIGTPRELEQHAALMRKHPGMEHDEPYMTHVKPGGKGTLVWNFNRPGEFKFACLVPGHYEAGMTGTIVVARAPSGATKP